jgi:AraC-like DNA-binding protein
MGSSTNRSQLVPLVVQYLRERDIDTSGLIAKFGMIEAEVEKDVTVPLERMHAFFDAAERLAGDPFLGVHVALFRQIGAHGLLEYCWRNAATVGDAMQFAADHFSFYGHNGHLEFKVDGDTASFLRKVPHPLGSGRLANEFFVVSVLLQMRESSGHAFLPTRAYFNHPQPPQVGELVRAVGTPRIEFDRSASGFDFPAELAELPMQKADPNLFVVLRDYLKHLMAPATPPSPPSPSDDLIVQLREAIRKRLPHGEPTLSMLAAACKTSTRTLQRRLAISGTTLKRMIDSVREVEARNGIVDGDTPLSDLAAQLGYRDTRSLLRAFKRWTGLTPTSYRASVSS